MPNFHLRGLTPGTRMLLTVVAAREGTSVNQWILNTIQRALEDRTWSDGVLRAVSDELRQTELRKRLDGEHSRTPRSG